MDQAQDPQLLDHRAHRPRQVDARGSHPPADRHGRRPRHEGAAARLDGARARARDHDQGAGGARALEGAPAEPDRHARPRRLHLRGLALAAGVRGRPARRRRGAGDRGADARERLPRDRERPRDRPAREQDRPAAGRPGRRGGGGRRPDRRRRRTTSSASPRRPGRASRRCSTRSSSGSRRRAAIPTRRARALIFDSSYDQYRGVVAFVRVVDGRFETRERAARDGAGHALRGGGARLPLARAPAGDGARGGRGRLRDHRAEGRLEAPRRRHAHGARSVRPPSRCPATRT